ncbi:MAG: hypothetical protein OHK0046_30400 [Anaerolineae bacterium]
MALLFGGVLFYLIRNDISSQLSTVSLPRLLLAHLLLILGKLLLVELSRQSVAVVNWPIDYRQMFNINAMSQLAKYLPGGIWQYVGRAGYYAGNGLPLKQITRAMILENIWLIASASITGILAYALYLGNPLLALVLLLAWYALLVLLFRVYTGELRLIRALYLLALQGSIWSLLGLSLLMLLSLNEPGAALLAIGAFGLSWTIGYVALFAPGGIGVREGMLAAILGVVIAPADALVYAAVNRVVWVISELLLGLLARTLMAATPPPAPETAPLAEQNTP